MYVRQCECEIECECKRNCECEREYLIESVCFRVWERWRGNSYHERVKLYPTNINMYNFRKQLCSLSVPIAEFCPFPLVRESS